MDKILGRVYITPTEAFMTSHPKSTVINMELVPHCNSSSHSSWKVFIQDSRVRLWEFLSIHPDSIYEVRRWCRLGLRSLVLVTLPNSSNCVFTLEQSHPASAVNAMKALEHSYYADVNAGFSNRQLLIQRESWRLTISALYLYMVWHFVAELLRFLNTLD